MIFIVCAFPAVRFFRLVVFVLSAASSIHVADKFVGGVGYFSDGLDNL